LAEEAQQNIIRQNQTQVDLRRESIKHHIGVWIASIVIVSTIVVFVFGTIFYCHGMRATKGRFENIPGV
jgi:t-SNARE complex subunit (syntaxin)